jgi:hypothetical protein
MGRKADHLIPSSAEVMNVGAIPPAPPPIRFDGVMLNYLKHRDNFCFILKLMLIVFNMEFYNHNDKLRYSLILVEHGKNPFMQ